MRPRQFVWVPKPDITPYELARALPAVHVYMTVAWERELAQMISALHPDVRRHFDEVDPVGSSADAGSALDRDIS